MVGAGAVVIPGNRWDLLDGRRPAAPPRVSVVVVHFEQPAQLARTLAALARQTLTPHEVIVVDDASRRRPRVPSGVTLLVQPDAGFRVSAARNAGAARATGDVLVFLDADTTPEPAFLQELARLPALEPRAVVVGRRRHADLAAAPADEPVEVAGPPRELPAPAWLAVGYEDSRDLLDADDRSYRFVISAVLATGAAFFRAVGGFDETFDGYGGEDWEWAHRAWLAGALLAHVPTAVAWHDGPEWAGRGDEASRRAQKNAEAVRLADRIAVPGSRPRGLRSAAVDVLVLVPAAPPAATWLCVDSVLAALPEATVVVPDPAPFAADPRVVGAGDARARITVTLARPVRVVGDELRAAVDGLGPADALALGPDVRVVHARASDEPLQHHPAPGLVAITEEPDLEAHLGGWA